MSRHTRMTHIRKNDGVYCGEKRGLLATDGYPKISPLLICWRCHKAYLADKKTN